MHGSMFTNVSGSLSLYFQFFKSLLTCCLFTCRPSASALLQHSFFKQIRRKSQAESLPDLLRPVQPLSQVSLPPDQSDLDDITQSLAQANIDHQHWDFD